MSEIAKIQPVAPCGAIGKCMASPQSYASYMSGHASPRNVAARALQELEKARALDIATHEKNLPAIEANKEIKARVEAVMVEIGMPGSYSERDRNSRARYPKTISHEAGYIGDLRRHCVTNDNFDSATDAYARMKREYEAYALRAEEESARADRERQREANAVIERRKADMELASILLRYALPIESSWGDVLDALCSKDQRLNLAIAMEQTRGDWSEGPYRVENALDRFTIETAEDEDIVNDVQSCLIDFEDGRVFRDTEWSYSAIYASIKDAQLLADAKTAMSRREQQ